MRTINFLGFTSRLSVFRGGEGMILKQRAPRFYIRYFPSSIERRCNYLSGSVLKGRNDPWKIYRFINNIQQHRSIIEHGVQIFEKKRYKKKRKKFEIESYTRVRQNPISFNSRFTYRVAMENGKNLGDERKKTHFHFTSTQYLQN